MTTVRATVFKAAAGGVSDFSNMPPISVSKLGGETVTLTSTGIPTGRGLAEAAEGQFSWTSGTNISSNQSLGILTFDFSDNPNDSTVHPGTNMDVGAQNITFRVSDLTAGTSTLAGTSATYRDDIIIR
ncbi:MAG: hypothetical protein Q4G49_00605 [Paracoccus sp. (in: a-proteobacteria)]|nr:hypothetical protein [Paracoccus sp. (in: a-proteobacteria)]